MSYGYWLKGELRIDVTGSTHIRAMINDPGLFGTTRAEILDTYTAHGEKIGFEGKARAIIMRRAILDRGFIRVRQTRKPRELWVIECASFNRVRSLVGDFIFWLAGQSVLKDGVTIHINELYSNRSSTYRVEFLNYLIKLIERGPPHDRGEKEV